MLNWKRFAHRHSAVLPQCHAATIAQLPDDSLLCAWYAGAYQKAHDVAIYGARLTPDAEEWSPETVFADTPGFSEGNPVLGVDVENRVWLYHVTMLGARWDTCQIKYSHLNGMGWKPPMYLQREWGWMTACKPLNLADGTILLPLYEENGTAFVLISPDCGRTWETSNFLTADCGVIQPSLCPLADGSLLMYLRTLEKDNGTIWQSRSQDNGRTWSEPLRTHLPNPSSRVDLTRLQSGRLILAFNDSSSARTPLTLALSEDEGKTWALRYDIESETHEEFSYPALIQSRDGVIHVAYTYRNTHIAHLALDEAWIFEHGRTVSEPTAIW